MIVYNVTIKVELSINTTWLSWLKEEHIPEIVGTGCFTHAIILKILGNDESDGVTYAIQYHTSKYELYKKYIDCYSSEMRQKAIDKWGSKFIAWRTVMHILQ